MYDEIVLSVGSRYRIQSMGTRDEMVVTHGVYRGQVTLGDYTAVAIELDDSHKELAGKIRLIPSHMILALDMLSIVEEADEADEETERSYI